MEGKRTLLLHTYSWRCLSRASIYIWIVCNWVWRRIWNCRRRWSIIHLIKYVVYLSRYEDCMETTNPWFSCTIVVRSACVLGQVCVCMCISILSSSIETSSMGREAFGRSVQFFRHTKLVQRARWPKAAVDARYTSWTWTSAASSAIVLETFARECEINIGRKTEIALRCNIIAPTSLVLVACFLFGLSMFCLLLRAKGLYIYIYIWVRFIIVLYVFAAYDSNVRRLYSRNKHVAYGPPIKNYIYIYIYCLCRSKHYHWVEPLNSYQRLF